MFATFSRQLLYACRTGNDDVFLFHAGKLKMPEEPKTNFVLQLG